MWGESRVRKRFSIRSSSTGGLEEPLQEFLGSLGCLLAGWGSNDKGGVASLSIVWTGLGAGAGLGSEMPEQPASTLSSVGGGVAPVVATMVELGTAGKEADRQVRRG